MVIGRERGKVRTGSQSMTTRPSAVAGLFYADDPDRLRTQVLDLLGDVAASTKVMPKALIAPHAGYAYSGRVAAAAFATLRDSAQTITRVVLIGPAHYVHVRGIAAPTVDAFETPLGRVPVDLEALSTVADLRFVTRADAPHAREHALEVELPFLQTVLPSFQVVPLVVGDAAPQDVAHVLRQLWLGRETLIVVSSDLSHYHSYEAARRLDASTAAAIEHGEWANLGPNQACGCLPVAGLLIEAERRGLHAQRLSLCNSGDTAGARDRVVGYGAWMFA
ncbi:MAG: AmmeMemoRadiSam system protein B [Xanthobacteraceae bacterium]|jgi:MEMO1 family protein